MLCPICDSPLEFRDTRKKDDPLIKYYFFHCSKKSCIFANPRNIMSEPIPDKDRVHKYMLFFKSSERIKKSYVDRKMYSNAKKSFGTELITVYRFDLRAPKEIKEANGFYVKNIFKDDFYKRSSPFQFKGLKEINKSVGISTSTSLEKTDLFAECYMEHLFENGDFGDDFKGYIYKINLSGQAYFKIENKFNEINVPGKIDYNKIETFFIKSLRCSVLFDPNEKLMP